VRLLISGDLLNWEDICCHYFLEGSQIIATEPAVRYADSHEQLGIEPLHFRNNRWSVAGPTWTEQTIEW
jgi:hypothetical protein